MNLSNCKHCGGDAMWNPVEKSTGDYATDLGYVDCLICGVRTEGRTSKAVAYAAWNRVPAISEPTADEFRKEILRLEKEVWANAAGAGQSFGRWRNFYRAQYSFDLPNACGVCHGSGKFEGRTCPACDGKGHD